MHHIAIMKKQWGLIPKILSKEKTVESRWYKNKVTPWNKIKVGDTLYFKESGKPVTVKVKVIKVEQFEVKSNTHALEIMQKRAKADLGTNSLSEEIKDYILNKNYAVFVYFNNVVQIKPFEINKKGFGLQAAWLTLPNIDTIKIK